MGSLIHPSSAESVTFQLVSFFCSISPKKTSLEDGFFSEYGRVSVLTPEESVEFCISAENSNYIHFANTFLYVRASITATDGTDLAENSKILSEYNFLHTLW